MCLPVSTTVKVKDAQEILAETNRPEESCYPQHIRVKVRKSILICVVSKLFSSTREKATSQALKVTSLLSSETQLGKVSCVRYIMLRNYMHHVLSNIRTHILEKHTVSIRALYHQSIVHPFETVELVKLSICMP